MTLREFTDRLRSDHERRLKIAEDAWDALVGEIRDNPNKLNVRGIWVADLLAEMVRLHALIIERDRELSDIRMMIADMERTK